MIKEQIFTSTFEIIIIDFAMKLILNNVTYHNCPVQVREKVAFTDKQRRHMLRQMHVEQAVSEAVILQTCNRLEFYLYAKRISIAALF